MPTRFKDGDRDNPDPIPALIKLYSLSKDAVTSLSACRINPDMRAKVTQRRDLEFYIPQLLSFYVHGYFDNSEQLENLLLRAARSDHFFSHRILFFLRAFVLERLPDQEKAKQQKKGIDKIF